MSNEIVKETNSFNDLIAQALKKEGLPAESLNALLDANERIMAKQAEIDFNEALARIQPKMPFIDKTSKAHNSTYAKYENIQAVVRPIYTEEGFSISFTSKREGDLETYYGTLMHKSGHSKTAEISLPADTSGSKNAIQAKGSTLSYAKRYLLCALLDIIVKDEDDDAQVYGTYPIDEVQYEKIQSLIESTGTDEDAFCKHMKVDKVINIKSKDYAKAIQLLKAKEKKNANKA